jgi:ABC-type branched-subunit amino acid transport system ATPase component
MTLLKVEHAVKKFGGLRAVDDVYKRARLGM